MTETKWAARYAGEPKSDGRNNEKLLAIRFRFAGVARQINAGGAAEGGDAESGIVGEGRQAGKLGGMTGLGQRIFDEGAVRLLGFRNAELALGDDFETERRQQCVQLVHLLGVVGGEDDLLHVASALCWAAISCRMPASARSVRVFICGRVNGVPSAVPWISTMPPEPVMTTFMSVSQSESSG